MCHNIIKLLRNKNNTDKILPQTGQQVFRMHKAQSRRQSKNSLSGKQKTAYLGGFIY
jgi:hypothetical protein